jgi:predicted peptidase
VISYGLPAVLALGEQPEGFEFVVISPQAQPGTTWFAEGQLEMVDDVIQEALDTYLVDEDRVYLTGLSMGGYASWHLASQFPIRFAAMSSLSGSGYQLPFTPAPEYSCPLALVPIWGFHGEQDLISEYRPVALQVSAWESQCGARVRWTAFPDAGHIETYERVYRAPDLYDWMLEHQKG